MRKFGYTAKSRKAGALNGTDVIQYVAELLVGGNTWGATAGSGKGANLKNPSGVAVDADGAVFIADTENNRILVRGADGAVTPKADGIEMPWSLAVGPGGVLWVHAFWELWRISAAGEKTRVMDWRTGDDGVLESHHENNGEAAASEIRRSVTAIAVDGAGTLYFTDGLNDQVCKLTNDGDVVVIAGSGQAGYADGPADQAKFRSPRGIAVASDGTIFVTDNSSRIRKITLDGQVVRVAGTYEGKHDGPADVAEFEHLGALAIGPDGRVYVSGLIGNATRVIRPDGYVSTLSGIFERGKKKQEGEVASNAVAIAPDGILYVAAKYEQTIWKLTPKPRAGIRSSTRRTAAAGPEARMRAEVVVTTLAGSWEAGQEDGEPEHARFNGPTGILAAPEGLFVTDTSNHRVRRIAPDGIVSTVAGTMRGEADGEASSASFFEPMGLARASSGDFLIADTSNDRIRCLSRTMQVTTVAGQKNWNSLVFHMDEGTMGVVRPDGNEFLQPLGVSLDWIDYQDGKGTGSKFNNPIGLVVEASGNVLIADNRNGRIRQLAPDGTVTTRALHRSDRGLKTRLLGEPIRSDKLAQPVGLAVGPKGDLFVSEAGLARINRITADGEVHLLAGGTHGFADGSAKSAAFDAPAGIAIDADGIVYVADTGNHRVRRITKDGKVETVAGGDPGYVDGPGHTARFNEPWGLAFDLDGSLYVSDRKNNAIRKIQFASFDHAIPADLPPGRFSDIVTIYSHSPGRVVRGKAAPAKPRLNAWEQCVGRRIRLITKGSPFPFIRLYFDDAWIEIEGVGQDPMPYFKDGLHGSDFHLDASHLVGKTIVRLDLAYGEPGGTCEYVGFKFDDGSRQWLEPHYGSGLRIS